jgi:hypothetical protein
MPFQLPSKQFKGNLENTLATCNQAVGEIQLTASVVVAATSIKGFLEKSYS